MEKFKTVALDNFEFENRLNDKNYRTLSNFPHQDSNLKNRIRVWSTQESSNSISFSIQTLTEEFKNLLFKKIEYRDVSILKAILPFLANQDSDFNVRNELCVFLKSIWSFSKIKHSIELFDGKMKQVKLENLSMNTELS